MAVVNWLAIALVVRSLRSPQVSPLSEEVRRAMLVKDELNSPEVYVTNMLPPAVVIVGLD